ncbi:MAG: efflux RND transporter permease subunit [Patescibacteria group bacterium]|nr:efflux RND transporter permease subunit [Patescibacteria group bacterium]
MDSKINPKTRDRLAALIRKFEKSPLSVFIRRRKLSYLIILFLLLVGIFQIKTLPRELNPEVEIPIGLISVSYPGASSLDVEEQVTKEIESKISGLEGISKLESSSSFGFSRLTVEFEPDQNLENSIRKLKDKVDEAKPDLPEDANDPQVTEVSIIDYPIFAFSLQGKNHDKSELKEFAQKIKDRVKGINGVDKVEIIGGEEKEIKIELLPDKLSELGVSAATISNAINSENINLPIGSVEIGKLAYSVRVENEFQNASQIGDLIVDQKDQINIRLKDVANVYEDFETQKSVSRISVKGQPFQDTVSIQIYKKTGGDVTKIAKIVKETIEQGRGSLYPQDVEVVLTTDYAYYVEKSISDLVQNGLGTIVIVLILLLIFLGPKEAFIASLAIPFSFFISFSTMALTDQSLNFITLFSLVLALGLLVDSAVVIVEGMYEKITKYRMSGYAAAMLSVQEYAAPLLSGMLTTVAAFVPLLFIKGIFGQFLVGIPIIVISTLTAALFVSLAIIPTIGSVFLHPKKDKDDSPKKQQKNFLSRNLDKIASNYREFLYNLISSKRNRRLILIMPWLVFFACLYLPVSGYLKMEAFGNPDSEYFWVSLKMPEGTVKEETDRVTTLMEEQLYDLPEVESLVSSIGAQASNQSSFTVNLTKRDQREISSPQIVQLAREKLSPITYGRIEIQEESGGPPAGSALEARVSGPDLIELEKIALDLKKIMQELPGTEEIDTNLEYNPGEFLINFNPEVLAAYSLSTAQVAGEIRKGVSGDNSAKITRQGDELKINISYGEKQINNLNYLRNITISAPNGEKPALGNLADIKLNPSISSINRRDEERTITIQGKNKKGTNINEVMTAFQEQAEKYNLPSGYEINYGGVSQEQNEVYLDMFYKMIIGIILILFILVAQFNSYRQALIILLTFPLALIGVILGMTLANMTLDIPAFIGVISLSGIVVNNAIILIDCINKMRQKDKALSIARAAAISGKARLRPIILTTATTVLGLLPLSIREPDWRNMGFTIIFGLTFSTLLTLFVVPSLYVSLESLRKKKIH